MDKIRELIDLNQPIFFGLSILDMYPQLIISIILFVLLIIFKKQYVKSIKSDKKGLKDMKFLEYSYLRIVMTPLLGFSFCLVFIIFLLGINKYYHVDNYKLAEITTSFIFFGGLLIVLIWFEMNKVKKSTFFLCPYCDKSVVVKENWRCDSCNNLQGVERYISMKCKHCGKRLGTASCEHCEKEFII